MTHASSYDDHQIVHQITVRSQDGVDTLADVPNDMEQVRALLFGTQQRENERQLRGQERRTEEIAVAVKRLTERVDRDYTVTLDLVREQYNQLQQYVNEHQRMMQDRLRDQQRDFEQRLESLQTSLTAMLETLDQDKVDQHDLADMLSDFSTRLKRARPN